MYTIMTGLSRWRACLALAIPLLLFAACTDDGLTVAPSAPQLTPAAGGRATDLSGEAWVRGSVSILLEGPWGVSSLVQANPVAQAVHADVTASIYTLRKWHGTMSSTEVTNACTALNGTTCGTWDDIPNYCSVHADDPDEGAPGAAGQASGYMTARWEDKSAMTTANAYRSCPSLGTSGGSGGNPVPGSGGQTCYEAWYVWADGSHPDQFIGIVCFGGGINAS